MQIKIFFKTFPETSRCPSCSAIGKLRRSRCRGIFEEIIRLTQIIGIYKCRECGWRGYLKKFTVNRYSVIALSFYLFLIFSVAYIITKVLKKNFGE